jgi:DNA-binding HxlR family transcriptional regulator
VDVIGDWWSLLIVRDAFHGRRRFGEFERSLGVAKNILTGRLRKLVAAGVLEALPAADGSSYKEYALTEKGRGLLPVLAALGQWGACPEAGFALVDRKRGKAVRLELRSEDGRRLSPDDVRLVSAPEA